MAGLSGTLRIDVLTFERPGGPVEGYPELGQRAAAANAPVERLPSGGALFEVEDEFEETGEMVYRRRWEVHFAAGTRLLVTMCSYAVEKRLLAEPVHQADLQMVSAQVRDMSLS